MTIRRAESSYKQYFNILDLPKFVYMAASDAVPESRAPLPDGCLKWAGECPLLDIAQEVEVKMNGFGAGRVEGYFQEHGWLGLLVRISKQPEWHVKQRGAGKTLIHVFGPEVRRKKA